MSRWDRIKAKLLARLYLKGPYFSFSFGELMTRWGLDSETTRDLIRMLINDGLLEQEKDGSYKMTYEGRVLARKFIEEATEFTHDLFAECIPFSVRIGDWVFAFTEKCDECYFYYVTETKELVRVRLERRECFKLRAVLDIVNDSNVIDIVSWYFPFILKHNAVVSGRVQRFKFVRPKIRPALPSQVQCSEGQQSKDQPKEASKGESQQDRKQEAEVEAKKEDQRDEREKWKELLEKAIEYQHRFCKDSDTLLLEEVLKEVEKKIEVVCRVRLDKGAIEAFEEASENLIGDIKKLLEEKRKYKYIRMFAIYNMLRKHRATGFRYIINELLAQGRLPCSGPLYLGYQTDKPLSVLAFDDGNIYVPIGRTWTKIGQVGKECAERLKELKHSFSATINIGDKTYWKRVLRTSIIAPISEREAVLVIFSPF